MVISPRYFKISETVVECVFDPLVPVTVMVYVVDVDGSAKPAPHPVMNAAPAPSNAKTKAPRRS
jgi:hypothetical protein